MATKHYCGEDHHLSRLTEEQVLAIRKEYVKGVVGHKKLAKKYGVTSMTIHLIVNRITWKHI